MENDSAIKIDETIEDGFIVYCAMYRLWFLQLRLVYCLSVTITILVSIEGFEEIR